VTDIGAALQGGLGMAASGNLHPGRTSMFEPVHGSAPPLAGRDVANPVGAILSAALLLESVGRMDDARRVERAVEETIRARDLTPDVGGTLGTREVGEAVIRRLR
jgi:3-isopropylmalate dehydrogenase